jgi:hypothetical protein
VDCPYDESGASNEKLQLVKLTNVKERHVRVAVFHHGDVALLACKACNTFFAHLVQSQLANINYSLTPPSNTAAAAAASGSLKAARAAHVVNLMEVQQNLLQKQLLAAFLCCCCCKAAVLSSTEQY